MRHLDSSGPEFAVALFVWQLALAVICGLPRAPGVTLVWAPGLVSLAPAFVPSSCLRYPASPQRSRVTPVQALRTARGVAGDGEYVRGPTLGLVTSRAPLELLLFVLGQCELDADTNGRMWYHSERIEWSKRLNAALTLLEDHIDLVVDEPDIESPTSRRRRQGEGTYSPSTSSP